MDQQTLIFDISSDEEFGFDNSSAPEDLDWISKLLDDATNASISNGDVIDQKIGDINVKMNNKNDDDDDDVVVVGEVIVKPKRAKRSFSMVNYGGQDDDDDCVLLDYDPDKPSPLTGTDNEVKHCDGDGDDDLVVVGEKGQVACRDFPHSRHLCANFPFSSTSHESRCDLCHCYVCDSLAPCAYWGSGTSTADHCHATDKLGYWQNERKKFRQLINPPLPISKPVASLAQFPQSVQVTQQHCLLPTVASNGGVHPPFGIPNIVGQGRSPRPSVSVARNGFQSQLVYRQLLRACNSDSQGNIVAQLSTRMPPRPMFKRPGFAIRSGLPNQAAYCSPNNVSVAYSQPQQLGAKSIEYGSSNLQGSSPRLVMSPTLRHSNPRTSASHLPGYNRPSSHTATPRFQGCSEPTAMLTDGRYTNSSMYQAQMTSSPLIPCNTSSALKQAAQSSQQHSIEIQNISVPNFLVSDSDMPTNITQMSHQATGIPQNYSSNPCYTLNVPNNVAHSSSLVEVEVPINEPLPFVDKDSQTALDFDVDSWLDGNFSDTSFLDMSSQSSQTTPIDTGMLYFDFETSWQGLAHS